MKRIAVCMSILVLLGVGILLAVAGISILNSRSSESDSDWVLLGWTIGWLALFIAVPCCLGAGLVAALCRPWRSHQASKHDVGRRDGTIIQRALLGAMIGFFAGALLAAIVMTAVSLNEYSENAVSVGLLYCPYGAVPGLVIGAVIGAVMGERGSVLAARALQGTISPSDILPQDPGKARCPFCHSTTFHVEEDAGSRRCSDCHSVLPSYMKGNR